MFYQRLRSRFSGLGIWPAAVVWIALSTGCLTPVKLKEVQPDVAFRQMQSNAITDRSMSPHTAQTLRVFDLTAKFKDDSIGAMKDLRRFACEQSNRHLLFSLSELSYLTGLEAEKDSPTDAMGHFLSSARFAYAFLFDVNVADPPNVYDPRFRLGCELYNHSLARALSLLESGATAEMGENGDIEFSTWDGPVSIHVYMHGFPEEKANFSELLLATNYRVTGINNHYRTFGLGIPLIAIAQQDPANPNMPPRASYPATALLRFSGEACHTDEPLKGTLDLYDPLHVTDTQIDGVGTPIESDVTTPLAYILSDPALQKNAFIGLFRADRMADETGLYMLEPYDSDRIPVVFVHGLVSSPLTWAQTLNDLRGDPVLRERYQFWFYQYPTGLPFVVSAGQFRRALQEAQERYNPNHDHPAFNQMVLIGHSMGGLLSKMMVQNSGDALWTAISRRPIDDLSIREDQKKGLRSIFYFEPLPCVRRVVFIATPHAGSDLSELRISNLIARVISLPKAIVTTAFDVLTLDLGTPENQLTKRDLTSVKNLSPNNRFIRATQGLPIAENVRYHSIIGNIRDGAVENGDDGAVAYTSAHLDGAASECVIPTGHSVQYHPLAILEVRRILMEHLETQE